MKTHAAVLWGREQDWKIEEIDLDPPRRHEVLVKWAAAGLCHSDEHLRSGEMGSEAGTGQPAEGGAVPWWEVTKGEASSSRWGRRHQPPGRRPCRCQLLSICGRCKMCITGHSNLCDLGAATFLPGQIADGTVRYHLDGRPST